MSEMSRYQIAQDLHKNLGENCIIFDCKNEISKKERSVPGWKQKCQNAQK